MQTRLSLAQLARPEVAQADDILRTCVHCGFCNATCPTYALLGDELDGPRGRIYLIKSWLEEERGPSASDVTHIDRCLSCLACVTTCPSGVDYMHLIDFARAEVETSEARTWHERWVRAALGRIVTHAHLFRWALRLGRLFRPFARLAPDRARAMLDLIPEREPPAPTPAPRAKAHARPARRRVALLRGCVQDELRPQINDATLRLLARLGCEVVDVPSSSCCGALTHHLGQAARTQRTARATATVLHDLIVREHVDTIVCSASGCGTMLKDYVEVLRGDARMEEVAREIAARTRDVSQLVGELGGFEGCAGDGGDGDGRGLRVAVHAPCSIYHGQRLGDCVTPLLAGAGVAATPLGEAHLCCGSAGVYNVLQPDLARALRARKVELIRQAGPRLVVTGNIGCLMQIRAGLHEAGLDVPVVHAVELMDIVSAASEQTRSQLRASSEPTPS